MPVFQYKCSDCSSVFEHLVLNKVGYDVSCISCGEIDVQRIELTNFVPNKSFCPHDGELDLNIAYLEGKFSEIGHDLMNSDLKCGGCGVDGPEGFCGKGGGCGTGNCGCKKNQKRKLALDIFSPSPFK